MPPTPRSAATVFAQAQAALGKLAGKRLLLLGDMLLDRYIYGETVRISREAPVPVVRYERTSQRLGGAANTAANLSALGVEVIALGLRGADGAGQTLQRLLERLPGLQAHLAGGLDRTPVKTRILAGAFGTARQQVLRLDNEPSLAPRPQAIAELKDALGHYASKVDGIVISDYGAGTLPPALCAAVSQLGKRGHLVCVDSRYQLAAFPHVTAIKPNVPEAEAFLGQPIGHRAAAEAAGMAILSRLPCQACLLTQGRHGMTLLQQGADPDSVDVVGRAEVTDVTGAGDTVMAVFAACVAADLPMATAMRLANCAAGVVVQKLGPAVATPKAIAQAAAAAGLVLDGASLAKAG